ncbi:MAG: hypothetical protein HZA24_06115 [Nitrospirae bacterium]|nr:hypothetical protein [Nitrospirota bacterium]
MSDIVQDETPPTFGVEGYDVTGEETGPPPAPDAPMDGGAGEGHGPEGAPPLVPVRALIEERRKRREAEQQLAALAAPLPGEGGFAASGGFAGPAGWAGHGAAAPPVPPQLPPHVEDARMEGAEHAARSRHADFDHKLDAFTRAALARPALIQEMRASADPGEYAYRMGQALLGASQPPAQRPPDPRLFEARIRADERARLLAEQRAAYLTESLSGVQSAATTGDEHGWRPKSLEEILGA